MVTILDTTLAHFALARKDFYPINTWKKSPMGNIYKPDENSLNGTTGTMITGLGQMKKIHWFKKEEPSNTAIVDRIEEIDEQESARELYLQGKDKNFIEMQNRGISCGPQFWPLAYPIDPPNYYCKPDFEKKEIYEGFDHPWSECPQNPLFVIDLSTKKVYPNTSPNSLRITALVSALLTTPLFQVAASAVQVFHRAFKVFSFYHFWKENHANTLSEKLIEVREDLFRIALTPLCLACLELSAIYALVKPLDGAKLYNNFEKVIYGDVGVATILQPYLTAEYLPDFS